MMLFSVDLGISWPFIKKRHCFIMSSIYFFSVKILFSRKNLNTFPSETSYLPSTSIVRHVSLISSIYWLRANLCGKLKLSAPWAKVPCACVPALLVGLNELLFFLSSAVGNSTVLIPYFGSQLEKPRDGLCCPFTLTCFFSAGDPSVDY